MLRRRSNAEATAKLPVEVFYGDVLDPASLRAAMRDCGSVFYSVLDPRFWLTDPSPLYRTNVEGLVHAMDAALACGVERFVFTSTMGTLGLDPNGPVSEEVEFNWRDRACGYILSRLEAEPRFLSYCREKGLPGVALCVVNTYGPGDYQPTPHGKMLWDVARGAVRYMLDAGALTVDVRDRPRAPLRCWPGFPVESARIALELRASPGSGRTPIRGALRLGDPNRRRTGAGALLPGAGFRRG
jgi:dihydroflavonol-4-reductase